MGRELSTAYHEAGHAVIGHMLDFTLRSVSIDDEGGGATVWAEGIITEGMIEDFDSSLEAEVRLQRGILVTLAGIVAQRRHDLGSDWKQSGHDHSIRSPTDYGIINNTLDHVFRSAPLADAFLRYLEARTEQLVEQKWSWIESVALHIFEHGRFDGDVRELNPQVKALFADRA